jgi:hypothetical protein
MKKYIIKFSLIFLAALTFWGCNDDFLERYPLDEVSNESFWKSENDLKVYNNGLYNYAKDESNRNVFMGHREGWMSTMVSVWYVDEFSDNLAPLASRHKLYQQVRAGKHQPTTSSKWYGWSYYGWEFLRAVNVGMDHYDNAIENGVSEETVNIYKAEARLLRAMWYSRKVFLFGDIPWVDTELNVDDDDILYGTRTPKNEVMEKVLEDLNFACEWLPEDWEGDDSPGRVNRWIALHEKSRICLYQGTWLKYHGEGGETPWLQAAAAAAKELMESGNYELYSTGDPNSDYSAIHKMKNLTGVSEVIYWEKFDKSINSTNVAYYHKFYNGGATKSFVEDYLCTDGLPISLSSQYQGDESFEDVFVNRDPRLRQTILHPDDVLRWHYNQDDTARDYPRIKGMEGGIISNTGYHVIKVYELEGAHAAYGAGETPAIMMRYAETLLNYAEAMAELGTITQADLDISVNLIRDRVGMPHLTTSPQMDPRYANEGVSALIQEIRRERRIELFMEGFRYDDIRRWKQGQKLLKPDLGVRWDEAYQNSIDPSGMVTVQTYDVDGVPYLAPYTGTDYEVPEFDENKHYLWPIPISSISQNPNLTQTTGW